MTRLFQHQLTPKYLSKYQFKGRKLKPIPWTSFVEFCSYCRIRSGEDIKPFLLYPYQKSLTDLIDKHSVIQICKSRQLGITQVIVALFIYRAINNPAYVGVIFQRKQEDSSAIARRARQILENLFDYGIENESDNLGFMKLKNGGEIHFKNSNKEGSRSLDSVSDFLFDEAAFSENIKEIYSASSASSAMVSKGTKIIVSTPSSKQGFYWNMLSENNDFDVEKRCHDVVDGVFEPFHYWVDNEGICKILIHWKAHPIYSQHSDYLAYRKQQDGTDWETIQREYNLLFVNTEQSIFSEDLINNCSVQSLTNPSPLDTYFMGIDTSSSGLDYTVLTVLKYSVLTNRLELVDYYRDRQKTNDYHLAKISQLIDKYSPENIAIEINGVGQIYLEQLVNKYPVQKFKAIRTSGENKPALITKLLLTMESQKLAFLKTNQILIDEFLAFSRKGSKLQAVAGKHDDFIMSLAFCLTTTPDLDSSGIVEYQKLKSSLALDTTSNL